MDFIGMLKKELQLPLPGIEAQKVFYPMRGELPTEHIHYKKSAVGIHLFNVYGQIHFLLMQRSSHKGPHAGQMAFPGGKFELEDLTLEQTARRESMEEVGIDLESGSLLGQLSEVNIPVSKFKVYPFLFYHETTPSFKINEEVERIEFVNIQDLMNDKNVGTTNINVGDNRYLKNIPCFLLNNDQVWGATSIMLNELKQLLKRN